MYVPDPLELVADRVERLAAEQYGVPDGSFRCPGCGVVFDYEPITTSSRPDAPISCYDCLPDEQKAAWDEFEAYLARVPVRLSELADDGERLEALREHQRVAADGPVHPYTCGACPERERTLEPLLDDDGLGLRCPACGHVQRDGFGWGLRS